MIKLTEGFTHSLRQHWQCIKYWLVAISPLRMIKLTEGWSHSVSQCWQCIKYWLVAIRPVRIIVEYNNNVDVFFKQLYNNTPFLLNTHDVPVNCNSHIQKIQDVLKYVFETEVRLKLTTFRVSCCGLIY